jgi:hypothetical protein
MAHKWPKWYHVRFITDGITEDTGRALWDATEEELEQVRLLVNLSGKLSGIKVGE